MLFRIAAWSWDRAPLVLFLILCSLILFTLTAGCAGLEPPREDSSTAVSFEKATSTLETIAGKVAEAASTVTDATKAAKEAKQAADAAPGATEVAGISAAVAAVAGVLLNYWRNQTQGNKVAQLVKKELNGHAGGGAT